MKIRDWPAGLAVAGIVLFSIATAQETPAFRDPAAPSTGGWRTFSRA